MSWVDPGSVSEDRRAADRAAARRRDRRRRWIRPHSLTVVIVVIAVDAVAILAASVVQGVVRRGEGLRCSRFWAEIAHDKLLGAIIIGVVLGVVLLLCAFRWWAFLPALVVQLIALVILVPPLLHQHDRFVAVAEGRVSPVEVDSGGYSCDG